MAEYELVHEIQNLCPNNQMRDIFFKEVETDDPESYVRQMLIPVCKNFGFIQAIMLFYINVRHSQDSFL